MSRFCRRLGAAEEMRLGVAGTHFSRWRLALGAVFWYGGGGKERIKQ